MLNKASSPDFIIGGAMKSGTTSLHYILNTHSQVFIPEGEIYFFDIDDYYQHPDFFGGPRGQVIHDFEQNKAKYINWYQSFFEPANPHQVKGEDSTTYLASRKAPERIAELLPDVKLIFLLRNPVERTISHYWHLVRKGRAIHTLEKTLKTMPNLIQRSCYKTQIEYYYRYFPSEKIKIVIFENFIDNTEQVLKEICNFLELSGSIDLEQIEWHRNKSKYPISLSFSLILNRLLGKRKGYKSLPDEAVVDSSKKQTYKKNPSNFKFLSRFNLKRPDLTHKKPDIVKADTREFLVKLLSYENKGLSALIDQDLSQWWSELENI